MVGCLAVYWFMKTKYGCNQFPLNGLIGKLKQRNISANYRFNLRMNIWVTQLVIVLFNDILKHINLTQTEYRHYFSLCTEWKKNTFVSIAE